MADSCEKIYLTALESLVHVKSLDELGKEGLKFICETLNAQYGKILKRSVDAKYLEFWYGFSVEKDFWSPERIKKLKLPIRSFSDQLLFNEKRSISGHVAETGEYIVLEDVKVNKYTEFYYDQGEIIRSELVAPLCIESRVEYVLCLSSETVKNFKIEKINTYKSFCTIFGGLLSRLITESDIRFDNYYYSELFKLMEGQNPKQNLDKLLELVGEKFRVSYCGVFGFSTKQKYYVKLSEYRKDKEKLFNEDWYEAQQSDISVKKILEIEPGSIIHENGYLIAKLRDISGLGTKSTPNLPIGFFLIEEPQVKIEQDLLFKKIKEVIEIIKMIFSVRTLNILFKVRDSFSDLRNKNLSSPIGALEALQDTLKQMDYAAIHIWQREASRLKLILPTSLQKKKYHLKVSDDTLVTRVLLQKSPSLEYGVLNNKSILIKFPEIIPPSAVSWLGFPIISDAEDASLGVISCFDSVKKGNDKEVRKDFHLSVYDLPVMDFLSTIIVLIIELERANMIKIGKQSIMQHEINILIALVESNINVLYNRLLYPNAKRKPNILSSFGFPERSDDVVYDNIRTFMECINIALHRNSLLMNEWVPDKNKDHNLNKIVTSTVAMVRVLIRRKAWYKKKVSIHYDIPKYLTLRTDYFGMVEVLINMITNAVKYSHDNAEVKIAYNSYNKSIVVSNFGIGVNPSEADKIYLLGYQSEEAKAFGLDFDGPSEEYRNKGVGLYVSRKVMKILGGEIVLIEHGYKNNQRTVFEILIEKFLLK